MTALETRLDAILPTLATKADIAALRADMEKADLGLNAKFDAKCEELRVEIQQVELRMNAKFDAKFEELRVEIQQVELRTNAKFDAMRADIQQVELRMVAKFDSPRADMHKMNADIKTWALATMIAVIGTILAGMIGISQLYRSAMPHAAAAPAHASVRAGELIQGRSTAAAGIAYRWNW